MNTRIEINVTVFRERIRYLKDQNKLTYNDISKATGISESALKLYCSNEKNNQNRLPSFENIVILSNYFKVRSDWLLGLNEFQNFEQEIFGTYNLYKSKYKEYYDNYASYFNIKGELYENLEEEFVRYLFDRLNIEYIYGIKTSTIQRDTLLILGDQFIDSIIPFINIIDLNKIFDEHTINTLLFEEKSKVKPE